MPTSVIVGRLRAVEDNAIILGGGIRVALAPGVSVKDIPLETSVTVVAVSRDGMLYAESLRKTPDGAFGSLRRPGSA
jgi:hypothetical protein